VAGADETQAAPPDRVLAVLRLLKGRDLEVEARELGVSPVDLATWYGRFVAGGHEAAAGPMPAEPSAATDPHDRRKYRRRAILVLLVTTLIAATAAGWVVRWMPPDSLYPGRYTIRVPEGTDVYLAHSNTYYLLAESENGANPVQTNLTYQVQPFGARARELFPSVAAKSFPDQTRTCFVHKPAAGNWNRGEVAGTWAGEQYLQTYYDAEGVAERNWFGMLAISTLRDRGMLIFNVFMRGRQPDDPGRWQPLHEYLNTLGSSASPPVAIKDLAAIKPPQQRPLCLGPYTLPLPKDWTFTYQSHGQYQIQRGSLRANLWYRARMSATASLGLSTAVWKGWLVGRCLRPVGQPAPIRLPSGLGAGAAQRYEQAGPKPRHGVLAAIMVNGGDALVFDVSAPGSPAQAQTWAKVENLLAKLRRVPVNHSPAPAAPPAAGAQQATRKATEPQASSRSGKATQTVLPQGLCGQEAGGTPSTA
jgi:hypothetical protein